MPTRRLPLASVLALLAAVLPAAEYASAQQDKQGSDPLDRRQVVSPKLAPREQPVALDEARDLLAPAVRQAWESFRSGTKVPWRATVDRRTGFVSLAVGGGIAWLPGREGSEGAARPGGERDAADLRALEKVAREFVGRTAPLLGVDPASLTLNRERSGHPIEHLWLVDFDVLTGGAPVEGARVVFRVNHGNLIQLGAENLPSAGVTAPAAALTRQQALEVVSRHVGGLDQRRDVFRDSGSLHVLPVTLSAAGAKDGAFTFGRGRGLARVWQFVFQREGVLGTWRARVDAATGELLEFVDLNDYAQSTGGIFSSSPANGPEIVRPLPFVDLSAGGFSSSAGLYTFGGGALTSSLHGQYATINDTCGAVSLAADGSGNLAFGTSAGTDCTTPGAGGAGNTHASRQTFYWVNRLKEIARGWMPGNAWLGNALNVNVNLNQHCNAYWDGASLNFFQSGVFNGTFCNNTGEIAGVPLHEFGHGLDQNDGNGGSPDKSTSEATADVTSFLVLHGSCIGPGFRAFNCGPAADACTACTGVRDVDWAQHASGAPHTVANFSQTICPLKPTYAGACGEEGHCGSQVITEAVWDLVTRDLSDAGTSDAWATAERLWYSTRATETAAYTCNTAGATWTSDGCNVGSLWEVLRAADDDDGDLTNGTPHGAALFAAFNRHGIACAADPGAGVTHVGCSPPAAPTLTVTAGSNQATLSWTSSPGAVYDVFRNETGCNTGFVRIAAATAATTFADTALANGTTYYYQVVAYPGGNPACASPPSSCQSADLAGPDPSIRPWGASLQPPAPPYWQTPDIWVDNNNNGIPNEIGEPSRGKADNQLFARVTNVGNAAAGPYQVAFAAKPYTTNASAPAAAISTANEAGSLAPGASRSYQVVWDLTDAWIHPNFDMMFWNADHFCVQVTITAPGDANPGNNFAQNNFDNIPLASLDGLASAHFFLYNHLDHPAMATLQWAAHTPGWTVRFENLSDPDPVVLQPKQWLEVVAVATPSPGAARPARDAPILIDITQQLDGVQVGGLTLGIRPPVAPPSGPPPGAQPLLWLSLTGGGGFPLGSLRHGYDPGFNLGALLERPLSPALRAGLAVGYHAFAAKTGSGVQNLGVTEVSLVGRLLGPGPIYRPFALLGVGAYGAHGGWTGGVAVGTGVEAAISARLALTAGLTAHLAGHPGAGQPDLHWIEAHLGFSLGLP